MRSSPQTELEATRISFSFKVANTPSIEAFTARQRRLPFCLADDMFTYDTPCLSYLNSLSIDFLRLMMRLTLVGSAPNAVSPVEMVSFSILRLAPTLRILDCTRLRRLFWSLESLPIGFSF